MGLLDSLNFGNQGGIGGLLDMLMYQSPRPPEAPQPQYDALGNYTGITPQAPSPFGPLPQMAMPQPGQFQPQSPFNGNMPTVPVQQFAGVPVQPQAPQQPAPQQPSLDQPDRYIPVGDYQMAQFGPAGQPSQDAQLPPNATPTQGQMPQQQALPPALRENDGGLGGAFRGMAANAHTGPIGALIGGLGGAMGMESPAKQNLRAQYDALVPLLGQQKAMLAVMNPEAGKTLLAQALEKKQYSFTKLDNDTVVRQDPLTGKVEQAYGGARSDTIAGPDGKLITMPEGADPKTWRNEITRINADVAAGKKTEVQAKAEIFANKMELSNKSITDIEGTSLPGKIASGLPLGNYVQSPEYQKYKQASSNFITALLRQESGAAISKSEFDRYDKEYMPQPGDGKEVLAQKADARRVAIEGMKKGAGPGYKSPSASSPGVRVYNPTTGKIE